MRAGCHGLNGAASDPKSLDAGASPPAQMRLNSDGELETLKPEDWLALLERMLEVRRAGAGQDTPYPRILRRFVPE